MLVIRMIERMNPLVCCAKPKRPAKPLAKPDSTPHDMQQRLLAKSVVMESRAKEAENKALELKLQAMRSSDFRRKPRRQAPGSWQLTGTFVGLVSSGGIGVYITYCTDLIPRGLAYLHDENAPTPSSRVQMLIAMAGGIAIPFVNDYVERVDGMLPAVQSIASLLLLCIVMFEIALSLHVLPLFWGAMAVATFTGLAALPGLLYLLLTTYIKADPTRAGTIAAIAVASVNIVGAAVLLAMPFRPTEVQHDEGAVDADKMALGYIAMMVLGGWAIFLNTPQEFLQTSTFFANVGSPSPAGVRTTMGSVFSGLLNLLSVGRYRAFLLSCVCTAVFTGALSSGARIVLYYMEDSFAADVWNEYAQFGPTAFMLSAIIGIMFGCVVNRCGGMLVVYIACVGIAAQYAALLMLPVSALLAHLFFILQPVWMSLFYAGVLPLIILHILPDEKTQGRDMGLLGLFMAPACGAFRIAADTIMEDYVSESIIATPGGRDRYKEEGYHHMFSIAIPTFLSISVILHVAGTCLSPNASTAMQLV